MNAANTALLEDYKGYLKKQKLSDNTRLSYMRDISLFCEFIDCELDKVNKKTVASYIDKMEEEGKAHSTISRNIAALRKFYRFQVMCGKIRVNPLFDVETPHVEKKLPEAISQRDVIKLLNQPKCNGLKGYRDKAMLELLYATGIKVSELLNLTVRDVDIRGEMLCCSNNKNSRYIPIGKEATLALDNYIRKARHLMVSDSKVKTLFVNCGGTALTRQGFWKILRGYSDAAGIKSDVNAQSLRNAFALHLLENGADIGAVSEMLGHGDIVTTKIYDKVLKNNIKKIYKKAHPRA